MTEPTVTTTLSDGEHLDIDRLCAPLDEWVDDYGTQGSIAGDMLGEYHRQLAAAGFIIAPAADVQALARWALAIHAASSREGVRTAWLEQTQEQALAIPTDQLARLAGEGGE